MVISLQKWSYFYQAPGQDWLTTDTQKHSKVIIDMVNPDNITPRASFTNDIYLNRNRV